MEMSKILSAESAYERDLKSIERRLLRIEGKTNLLVGLAGLGLIPLFGRLFMPRLWTYEQYSSGSFLGHQIVQKRGNEPCLASSWWARLWRARRLLVQAAEQEQKA